MKRKAPPDPQAAREAARDAAKDAAKRAALRALRRARAAADKAGVELSDWEGEFLGSVEQRVTTYGRAFGDPDKGGPGQALSTLQAVKLKEIAGKAVGDAKAEPKRYSSFRRKAPGKA